MNDSALLKVLNQQLLAIAARTGWELVVNVNQAVLRPGTVTYRGLPPTDPPAAELRQDVAEDPAPACA